MGELFFGMCVIMQGEFLVFEFGHGFISVYVVYFP